MEDSTERWNEGIRVRDVPLCPLCSTPGTFLYGNLRDRMFNVPGVWEFKRCPACGMLWLNPRPVAEDVPNLYEEYHTHDVYETTSSLNRLRRQAEDLVVATALGYGSPTSNALQRWLGQALYRVRTVRNLAELSVMCVAGPPRGQLLDVGCGGGLYLSHMRDLGWQVAGVEPDDEAVRVARERFGLTIQQSSLEQTRFGPETFAAITLNHVIEHVLDPVKVLEECWRILAPGGRLVVVTPNADGWTQRLFKDACFHLDPPRHLYLFSPSTLQACAQQAGVQVSRLWISTRGAHWEWVCCRLIQRTGRSPSFPNVHAPRLKWEGLAYEALATALSPLADHGDELVLVADKAVREG